MRELITPIPTQEKSDYSENQFYYELAGTIDKYWKNFDNLQNKKHEFIEKYPERAQEIEIFFDFPEYCQIRQERDDKVEWKEIELKKKFETLTEMHFLVTNYLDHNDDKEGATRFWSKLKSAGRHFRDGEKIWALMRSGTVNQKTVIRLLREVGLNPRLAMPYSDAFRGKDLICELPNAEKEMSIQTKTGLKFKELDFVPYPVSSSGRMRISAREGNKLPHFRGSLDELRTRLGQDVISYEADIPRNKDYYDFDTGEPTKKCAEEFKEKFKKYQ